MAVGLAGTDEQSDEEADSSESLQNKISGDGPADEVQSSGMSTGEGLAWLSNAA